MQPLAPLPPGLRAWGLGQNSRQSRPPARGVMATTLPTWTMRKGRREERRHHDRRENGGGGSSESCVLEPPPLQLGQTLAPFTPGPPGHGGACAPVLAQSVHVLGCPEYDDLGLLCWGPRQVLMKMGLCMCRPLLSPPCKSGMVPGAEGMRARPTSPFSHYFSKGK